MATYIALHLVRDLPQNSNHFLRGNLVWLELGRLNVWWGQDRLLLVDAYGFIVDCRATTYLAAWHCQWSIAIDDASRVSGIHRILLPICRHAIIHFHTLPNAPQMIIISLGTWDPNRSCLCFAIACPRRHNIRRDSHSLLVTLSTCRSSSHPRSPLHLLLLQHMHTHVLYLGNFLHLLLTLKLLRLLQVVARLHHHLLQAVLRDADALSRACRLRQLYFVFAWY